MKKFLGILTMVTMLIAMFGATFAWSTPIDLTKKLNVLKAESEKGSAIFKIKRMKENVFGETEFSYIFRIENKTDTDAELGLISILFLDEDGFQVSSILIFVDKIPAHDSVTMRGIHFIDSETIPTIKEMTIQ